MQQVPVVTSVSLRTGSSHLMKAKKLHIDGCYICINKLYSLCFGLGLGGMRPWPWIWPWSWWFWPCQHHWHVVDLFLHHSSKCHNQQVWCLGCWAATCWKRWIWVSHDKAAPLFDMYDEPVNCRDERCKLHRWCFGWLAVTPSINKILSNFIITFYIYIYRVRKCFAIQNVTIRKHRYVINW